MQMLEGIRLGEAGSMLIFCKYSGHPYITFGYGRMKGWKGQVYGVIFIHTSVCMHVIRYGSRSYVGLQGHKE